MAFPTTLPSYTITAGAETLNGAAGGTGLSGLLNAFEVDITALGTKMGTGAATPTSGKVLRGNGVGTSTWGQVVFATDMAAFSSADILGVVNDETGTGLLVFNSSPTIVTPTIASFTNATHTHANAAGGGQLGTSALSNAVVTADKLATGAATSVVNTSETTTSTTYVALATAQAVTVTIGANGLALVMIGAYLQCSLASGNAARMSFAASGANTIAGGTAPYVILNQTWTTGAFQEYGRSWIITGLAAGSTTFTALFKTDGGTGTFIERNIAVLPL